METPVWKIIKGVAYEKPRYFAQNQRFLMIKSRDPFTILFVFVEGEARWPRHLTVSRTLCGVSHLLRNWRNTSGCSQHFHSFFTSPSPLPICSLSSQKKMIIGGCGALGAQGDFFLETDRLSEKRPERSAHEVLVPYSNF